MSLSPIIKVTLGTGANKQDISDRVTQLTYRRSLSRDDTVDIDIEGGDAEWLIDQPCCYAGSPVTFSYGYIGVGMTEEVTLSLGDIEPTYSGRNGCTLNLTSVDVSQAMKKLRGNPVWKKMKQHQIAEAVARIHNVPIEVQMFISNPESQAVALAQFSTNPKGDSTRLAEGMTTLDQFDPNRVATFKKAVRYGVVGSIPVPWVTHDSWPQGYMDNHEFLQVLAKDVGHGFICYTKGGKIYFEQRNNAAPPLRIITKGVSDIIRFKIKYREINGNGSEEKHGDTIFDPKTVERYIMLGDYHFVGSNGVISRVDKDGNREVLWRAGVSKSGTATDAAWLTINKALVALNVTNISAEQVEKYVMGHTVPASVRQTIDERFAVAQYGIQAKKDSRLTASLEEMGRLDMDVNIVIGTVGFSNMYSGNWLVWEVVDRVGKDGFFTTSELRKGEGKQGLTPTEAANKAKQAAEKRREVSAITGFDHPVGYNVNNPQVNPKKTVTIDPTQETQKAKVTTR